MCEEGKRGVQVVNVLKEERLNVLSLCDYSSSSFSLLSSKLGFGVRQRGKKERAEKENRKNRNMKKVPLYAL